MGSIQSFLRWATRGERRNTKSQNVRLRRLRGGRFAPGCEVLESRTLMSITPAEQLFIYLLNEARHNPEAYEQQQNLGIDLSTVAAQPPLAVNDKLVASASFHANEMATYNYFAHQSAVTGEWPNKMVRDQGYALPYTIPSSATSYWELPDDSNQVESIAAGNSDAQATLNQLLVDAGVSPPDHRIQLLGMDSFNQLWREVGAGTAYNASSTYLNYWAIHTCVVNTTDLFLTGVVYNDANGDHAYDLGEGLAGVTVTANGLTTTTNAAGGWSIPVTNGTYVVTASGGGFSGTGSVTVTVNGANVEADFISGLGTGYVNFSLVQPPLPKNLGVFNAGYWYRDMNGDNQWTSADGSPLAFAPAGATPVVGDWDGSGQTEIGYYLNGTWYLKTASGVEQFTFGFTGSNVIPVVGDWAGTGKTNVGVYANGAWFRDVDGSHTWDATNQAALTYLGWNDGGTHSVIPVPGHWAGDGKTEMGVYCQGVWFVDSTGTGQYSGNYAYWGWSGSLIPVVGNWSGTGNKDQFGVYYQGVWFRDADGTHQWDAANQAAVAYFGWAGAQPVVGDWFNYASSARPSAVDSRAVDRIDMSALLARVRTGRLISAMPDPSLRDTLINRVLPRVQTPGQYIGGEWNSICKGPGTVRGRLCLAYPEPYTIGMSHYGLQVLYAVMNGRSDWACERAFTPLTDLEALLREQRLPLVSLESFTPLREFERPGLQPAGRTQRDERLDDARPGRNPPGGRRPQVVRSAGPGGRPRLGQPGTDGPLHRRLHPGRRRRGPAGGVRSVARSPQFRARSRGGLGPARGGAALSLRAAVLRAAVRRPGPAGRRPPDAGRRAAADRTGRGAGPRRGARARRTRRALRGVRS